MNSVKETCQANYNIVMRVEIETQIMVDDILPVHMGEVVRDSENRGLTGYIDWCDEAGSRAGIPTAKLEVIGRRFEIQVAEAYRTPELNIGEELFGQLTDRLRSLGYVDLLIIGALDSALPFYHHVLDSMIQTGEVDSYGIITCDGRNTMDNHDLRVTFKPKDEFLPG